MVINYQFVVIFLIAAILLIVFLIRKNWKDKKDLEKQINQSELKPEKHDEKLPGI